MKRVIIASVMLFFAVSVSFVSSYYIDKSISEISNSAENLYHHPDKDNITETVADWQPVKTFLKYVTKHETVNEIDKLFSSLESAENEKTVREISLEIITLLDILKSSETASGENIF